jgi:hypothetical protein
MSGSKARFVVPILVVTLGVAWLLNVLKVIPGVDWIWTGGMAVIGILTLAFGGINKLTVVLGPFLLAGAVCSFLRQRETLDINKEIPLLVIVLGCLLILAQVLPLRTPDVLKSDQE